MLSKKQMSNLILISKEELKALLADTVTAAIRDNFPKNEDREELPEYLTRKQVAQYLACSLATVDNYSRAGLLKKVYINGLPRFNRDEVRRALEALA